MVTRRNQWIERLAEIGKRGQARRRELGLSVGGLAARLGCTRDAVYNLECYGAGTISKIEQWARALDGMDPAELAFGSRAAPRPAAPSPASRSWGAAVARRLAR